MGETETQSQREPASGLLGWIRRTPPLVLPMVVLSAGLVVAGAVAVKGLRTAADTITVTGASTERIRSDFADWTVVVQGSGTSQQAAYQDLQPDLQRTLAFLRTQGVPDGSVQLAVLESSSNDIRNRVNGALIKTEWSARQPIRISTPDVSLISKVSRSIGSLVGDGVSLTIQPPAYTYTKLADKRVDMLAKATADARKRAVAIALRNRWRRQQLDDTMREAYGEIREEHLSNAGVEDRRTAAYVVAIKKIAAIYESMYL